MAAFPGVVALLLFFHQSEGNLKAGEPLDHWTLRNPLPISSGLSRVAYGNGIFLAVGENWAVVLSSDGIHWTNQVSPSSDAFHSPSGLTFGNGLFVAVEGGTNIWTTVDGVSWSSRGIDLSQVASTGAYRIIYAKGVFVAVGDSGLILTSPDTI